MKKSKTFFITLLLFSTLIFLNIGYANYNISLNLNNKLTIQKIGDIRITNVVLDKKANNTLPSNAGNLTVDANGKLNLNFKFNPSARTETTYNATYIITIKNESPFEHKFTGIGLHPNIKVSNGTASTVSYVFDTKNKQNQLKLGNSILPNQTKKLAITLKIYVASNRGGNITITGNGSVDTSIDKTGNFMATIVKKDIDLSNGKNIDCFDIDILNTFKYRKNFTLNSSNKNFYLVKQDGSLVDSLYIDGPNDKNPNSNNKKINVCIKARDDSIFTENLSKTSIVLTTGDNEVSSIGDLNIKVDKSNIVDDKIPEIGEVIFKTVKYDSKTKSLITDISFKRLDRGGTDITSYYIELYNASNNQLIYSVDTKNNIENYRLVLDNNLLTNNNDSIVVNNNNFYVKVYGVDKAGNSGKTYCQLNDGNRYCTSSSSISLKYVFNLDTSRLNNINLSNTSNKVYLREEYKTDLNTPSADYALPGSINITMNGTGLTEGKAKYSQKENSTTSGTLIINADVIEGDIVLEGSSAYNGGVCLLEGTLIKLANGKYKKIEDIKYDDLIEAFSYDLGRIVYEYPIWIERAGVTDNYQRITFEDGEVIETVGSHGLYSADLNKYVSVLDRNNFHVGTRVVKFNTKNHKSIVKVKKIQTINEKAKYYHVSSTRYHNVIANNLLTTDAMLVVSNMFPFNKDMTWSKERDEFLAKNDLFYYYDWLDYFPKHIFEGFRMGEAKHLYNNNLLDIDLFSKLLGRLIKTPIRNKDNTNNMWMVTTEDDFLNNSKGNLYEEGTYYTLPKPNNMFIFNGWYNTSDDKIYMPGDKVEVKYGMYFEYVKKDTTIY